jgi:hypothetical protein
MPVEDGWMEHTFGVTDEVCFFFKLLSEGLHEPILFFTALNHSESEST